MGASVCFWLLHVIPAFAQSSTLIRIDASQSYTEPGPARYDGGTAKAPSGSTLKVNSRYLMRDGRPWLPVVGEFHYSRYPESRWEEEILKMKTAGIDVVAAYVIWIHHEEIEGQFDWTGQRNLRAFAQLCAKHGMYLEPRIGPWDHGEVRNGGFPDWLLNKGRNRVNDPVYLSYVRTWYGQVSQQLKGLLWKDGGPVMGIQLENEYGYRGPGAGEEHILELKRIARENGLDVPFYFVTGWDQAVVPEGEVLPVYGGYPDAPWDGSLTKLAPSEVYGFRFHSRVASNMGAIGGNKKERAADNSAQMQVPYLTAEIGGGLQDTYHRRVVIQPDDIAAMYPVMLGSGVNLYGTYMFQGGENPDGKLTTLQESQATGYPNDVSIKSYDFQAPLGEFGDERASFREMKVFQYFLNDFGAYLAPMIVHAPDQVPANPADLSIARAAVRSRGDSGFIFFNNYARNYSMPVRRAAQFEIRLPGGTTLRVPRKPVDLPSGSYFIWPFNFHAGRVTIRYSTAQLFTRVENKGAVTFYMTAIPGIPVEVAMDSSTLHSVEASSGETIRESGMTLISGLKPGAESFIDVVMPDGKKTRFVVLTHQEAENAWKVRLRTDPARDRRCNHLLITAQDIFADTDSRPSQIWLRSRGSSRFDFSITPPIAIPPQASLPVSREQTSPQVVRFTAEASERKLEPRFIQVQAAGEAPPVVIGPAPSWRSNGVAQAPGEGDLPAAAHWSITLPPNALDGLNDLYLQAKYRGDVARLHGGNKLLTDNFFNGQTWDIGLRRFIESGHISFDLSLLPLRKDAPVYFELASRLEFGPNGQIGELDDLRLVPEYQLVLTDTRR